MSLYTDIIHDEGLKALKDELQKRLNPKVPTEFIVELTGMIFF